MTFINQNNMIKDILKTLSISGVIGVTLLLFFVLFAVPNYRVWQQQMLGKARLAEAEQSKLIMIEDAKARLEAEKLNAEAEVARAEGMAEAMRIENGELSETYNQYLFIRSLEELAKRGSMPQIIYVPTDGMLPVMDIAPAK